MPQIGETRSRRLLVFYYPDSRATATHAFLGQGFATTPDGVKRKGKTFLIEEAEGPIEVSDRWLWFSDQTVTEEYVQILDDKKKPTGMCVWKLAAG